MSEHADRLDEALLDLAWSLWSALGVSSWAKPSGRFVIEVEPLLAFTAFVGRNDERLLREVTSWVDAQMSLLSIRQFKHVVTSQRWPFEGPVNDLGARLSSATGRSWPSTEDRPDGVLASDRPSTLDLQAPCSLQLRARSVFGVSSRAELVRVLALSEHPLTISELAARIAYTRRQVGADSELMVSAGFLKGSPSPGPMRVSLKDRSAVEGILGPVGEDLDWAPTFRLLTGLRQLVRHLTRREWGEPAVEVARQVRDLQPQLDRLDMNVEIPRGPAPAAAVAEVAMAIVDGILET